MRAVGEGLLGAVVDLDVDAVRPGGDRGARGGAVFFDDDSGDGSQVGHAVVTVEETCSSVKLRRDCGARIGALKRVDRGKHVSDVGVLRLLSFVP